MNLKRAKNKNASMRLGRSLIGQLLFFLSLSLILLLSLTSCSAENGQDQTEGGSNEAGSEYQAILSTTELVTGNNRVIFGIYKSAAEQLQDANVTAVFEPADNSNNAEKSDPSEKTSSLSKKSKLTYIGDKYSGKGLYLTNVDLAHSGAWSAELTIEREGLTFKKRVDLKVTDTGATPAKGADAPRTDNYVHDDSASEDIYYCTAVPPCSMHDTSIKGSIEKKMPLVILFASPGRCVSELCAPQLEITELAKQKFGDRVDFNHVEIFLDPESEDINSVVFDWGLPTEPWTFLVDKNGKIFQKFEGPVLQEELEAAIEEMLAA